MFGLSNDVIEDIRDVFRKHALISKVLIFGSRAKGNYSEGSDIDLAAIGNDLSFNELMDINVQIEDLGLLYKVDVVDYNKNKETPLGDHIDRVGLLFYEKG
ncbi:MAG: Nucleotidyltransferase domain protein [Bacteroidetes bacterium]|nr:Nucleotidyltransferase domain protein [Bacteroidota bacterium]